MRLPPPISQRVPVRLIVNLITNIAVISLLGVLPMHAAQGPEQLTCASSALHFGAVTVGETETLLMDLTNTGASSVTVSEINLNNAEFNVSVASLPMLLASGQSASVTVTFSPTTSGYTGGSVVFLSNASNARLKLPVSGTGSSSPSITATPSSVSFGSQTVGSTSTLPLVLTNTRKWAVPISSLQTSGAVFSITGPALPLTLPAGQSVTFTVAFAPPSAGTSGGSIFVQGPAVTVPLTGTGTAVVVGQLTIAPAALNFGNVTIGNSGNQALSLTAAGAAVTISSEASSSAQFALTGASFPLTIPAGQSVSLDVSFTPQTSTTASGTLSFTSNAATSTEAEPVTGTGVTPVYTVGLSWSPSTSEVTGYNVYRGAASTGPFSKINPSLNSTTAYTDNTVAANQTYYYVTTAVNSSNVESSPSTPAQAIIP
ncbi:MAG: choice-of-anchor D domain-containing protein [Candidatus Sulfotelmatobacter sp.]